MARTRRRTRRPASPRPRALKPVRLPKAAAKLIRWERVCRIATVGGTGMPHLVPVCHVLDGGKIYFGSGTDGRKVLNLRANPELALTVDGGAHRARAPLPSHPPAAVRQVPAVSPRGRARR